MEQDAGDGPWAAAGLMDTLLRWKIEPEVVYGNETAFSREFKVEAAKLVTERGVSIAKAVRDLDVHGTMVRTWIKEIGKDPEHAFPGKGVTKPEQAEIERLKREVAKLKMERDILKKAAAYFAKDSL